MIVTYDPESVFVKDQVGALEESGVLSALQLAIGRHESGLYQVQLTRTRTNPGSVMAMGLGYIEDVPPGQRRATWLLTDAVNMALTDAEAHMLLHW